ncbi:T9SS type A sorting domain-containing protein [Ornithobacterium rhinotracheale]
MKKFLLVFLALSSMASFAGAFNCNKISKNNGLITDVLIDGGRINIYPNPAKDSIYVRLMENENVGVKEIFIYNLLGDEVLKKQANPMSKEVIEINISNLKKGKYLVKVFFADNSSEVKPLIKQ